MTQTRGLFWRALVAFLAMPTVVAFVVPWVLRPDTTHFHPIALPVLGAGTVLLLWCVRDFYVAGRGTLAPWSPPKRLVTVGPYRVSRNPMYLAVCIIVAGWAFGFRAVALWVYAAVLGVAFHLRVVAYEEPWLARTFGAQWLAYRARVPRWIGRPLGAETVRAIGLLLALFASPLPAQAPAPRLMYIYRDSLERDVDSAYRVIEEDAARICADLRCPNPYLAIESLSGPHEVWWLNAFATDGDTARVAREYATNRALAAALGEVSRRKAALIGTPIEGYAVHRRDLGRGPPWSVVGARYIVVTITSLTRDRRPMNGSAWATADSTVYVLRPVRTRRAADAVARRQAGARVFAVRPYWSMPAPEWVAADPRFWRSAPSLGTRR